MQEQTKLLSQNDPAPVEILNPNGASSFLLVCDHAGRRVPHGLGDLGVPAAEWDRHIAWDIGAAGVCEALWPRLDATCITQAYSRLVIDCNRRPGHPTSIAPISDGTAIPGNVGLSEAETSARAVEIFEPYQDAIAAELDRRAAHHLPRVFIAMHSFTPVWGGVARAWHAGMLYNRDPRLAQALAALLREAGYHVGDNEPYQLSDDSDYTVPVHAERRSLLYVEIEIRQDLIADAAGQSKWADLLAECLPRALLACQNHHGAVGGD
jgi:predicted N-formylglutamate amidohydrolase